jgi:predicted Rossmann fold nucleotide-binding protein DprA/Smf involved in DNA uptake
VSTSLLTVRRGETNYPPLLSARLGTEAPDVLTLLGNDELLRFHKTGFFCSARAPGDAILRAHDAAREMRDRGVTVISGFHSPIERHCLEILLRGKQPLIVCAARAIEHMRLTGSLRVALQNNRLLVISSFVVAPTRVTRKTSLIRNRIVAALSDEAFVAHASPGGLTKSSIEMLEAWRVPTLVSNNTRTTDDLQFSR